MERGTYIAASGGLAQLRRLEVVNNNLANINTPGFKKEVIVTDVQRFDQTLASAWEKSDPFARGDHERTPGVVNARSMTDFSPGPMKPTGNPLDVALRKPNQFFVVNTPDGEQYTRAGNFTLNAASEVVTQDGFPVAGDGGSLTVSGPHVEITSSGAVRSGGQEAGRLRVVEIADPQTLERVGSSRFKLSAAGAAPQQVEAEVEPKSLEMANVSSITSVIDLMTSQRAFEMYTKTSSSIEQMNQSAINQIGRARS